jgi:hypothetical protein
MRHEEGIREPWLLGPDERSGWDGAASNPSPMERS